MAAEVGIVYCAVHGKFVSAECAVQRGEFLHGIVMGDES
jgi:hypothetical protein